MNVELIVGAVATWVHTELILIRVVDDRVHRSILNHMQVTLPLHPELDSLDFFLD